MLYYCEQISVLTSEPLHEVIVEGYCVSHHQLMGLRIYSGMSFHVLFVYFAAIPLDLQTSHTRRNEGRTYCS
jgi:hypothetical protein